MTGTDADTPPTSGALPLRRALLIFWAVILSLAVGLILPRFSSERGGDYLALATKYRASKRNADARRVLDRAAALGFPLASQWAEAGDLYRQLAANDRVVAAYTRALRMSPDSAEYRLGVARAYAAVKRDKQALTEYLEMVRRSPPGSESVLMEIGGCYADLGEHAIGEAHYVYALNTYTQSLGLRLALADLYVAWDRPAEAINWLQEAAEMQPSATTSLLKLGQVYMAQELPEQAVNAFAEATLRDAKDQASLFWLGEAYSALGHWAEAMEAYKGAVSLNPTQSTYNRKLGLTYLYLGECSAARTTFRKILDLVPRDAVATEGLRRCANQ